MWTIEVEPVACGLEETGYAHIVKNGSREIIVAYHRHKNWDRIVTMDIGGGYVREKGVGRREPDLTPHPDAVTIRDALNNNLPS